MSFENNIHEIKKYFQNRIDTYGTTAKGADWNSLESQNIRFEQLAKVIRNNHNFSILDYGCGYGAFADYLEDSGYLLSKFYGYDLLQSMVEKAVNLHPNKDKYFFTSKLSEIPQAEYAVASGVFNIRLEATYKTWTDFVTQSLTEMNLLSAKGFAANFLTKYSDPEKMISRLYYADPCFLFDYCKKHFSKNVTLLHDYTLYDFTIIVRK